MPIDVAKELLVLDESVVRAVLTPAAALESQRQAFGHLAVAARPALPRLALPRPGEGLVFCYLAELGPDAPAVCKVGGFAPRNASIGLPTIGAVVTVLDPRTGLPAALIDGVSLTEIRTAAATVLAAEYLAPDASSLAVLGTGVQAAAHLRAFCALRNFATVRVWGRDGVRADALAAELSAELGTPISAASSAQDAVADTTLVVLCTSAHDPVIHDDWVADGATVISVGSVASDRHEVGQELVRRAGPVVVDDPHEALTHVGPVVQARRDGLLALDDLVPLGDVVVGQAAGRREPSQVLLYFSVGLGAQDAAAATLVWETALAQDLGQRVALGR